MANFELIRFYNNGRKNREAVLVNAAHFSRTIWSLLEGKYLPPLRGYSYATSRVNLVDADFEREASAIWDLFQNEKIPLEERLVLGITFDKAYVLTQQLDRARELTESFLANNKKLFPCSNGLRTIALNMRHRGGSLTAIGFDQSANPQWKPSGRYIHLDRGDNIGRIII